MCVRGRERETDKQTESERDRERGEKVDELSDAQTTYTHINACAKRVQNLQNWLWQRPKLLIRVWQK